MKEKKGGDLIRAFLLRAVVVMMLLFVCMHLHVCIQIRDYLLFPMAGMAGATTASLFGVNLEDIASTRFDERWRGQFVGRNTVPARLGCVTRQKSPFLGDTSVRMSQVSD